MKRLILILLCLVVLPRAVCQQSATALNEGSQLIPVGNDTYEFTWWARAGASYLVDVSDDLVTWNYIDNVFLGLGGVSAPVYFNSANGSRLFARLNTDPFNTDVDGDGIPDGWEIQYSRNARDPNDALEFAPGGITYLQKFQLGLDPLEADSDGDGITDGQELAAGTDANNYDSFPGVRATAQTIDAPPGEEITIQLLGMSGTGDGLTYSETSPPTYGTITDFSGADGVVTFLAASEAVVDSFEFTVADMLGNSATATVTIDTRGIEPIAAYDEYLYVPFDGQGNALTYPLPISLGGSGGEGPPYTYRIVSQPPGRLEIDSATGEGVFYFQSLDTSFTYTVSDHHGRTSAPATVTVDGFTQNDLSASVSVTAFAPGKPSRPGPITYGEIAQIYPNEDNDDRVPVVPGQADHRDNSDQTISPHDDDIVKVRLGFSKGEEPERAISGTVAVTFPSTGFRVFKKETDGSWSVLADSHTLTFDDSIGGEITPTGPLARLITHGGIDVYVESVRTTDDLEAGEIVITSNLVLESEPEGGSPPAAPPTVQPTDKMKLVPQLFTAADITPAI